MRNQIEEAIADLPPKQRAIFVLRQYDELSHREIAGVVGSSEGAVRAGYFHAVHKLQSSLEDLALRKGRVKGEMKSTRLNCDRDALISWLDESLTQEASSRLRDHLTTCDACRTELKSLESTLELARSACQPLEMGPFEAPAFVHKVRGGIAARHHGVWRKLFSPALGGGFVSGAVVGALALFVALGPVTEPGFGTQVVLEPAAGSALGGDVDEVDGVEAELAGAIDDYLLDTASEQELFSEMESLIGEEDLLALLEEY